MESRKNNRLPEYDYSAPGAYFITVCTKDKQCTLGTVVGGGALDAPTVHLSEIGSIVKKYVQSTNRIQGITVDKYVIMPNHIHLILLAAHAEGTSKAPSPTNALVPHTISTLKRFVHRDAGMQVFQRSYHDHVIRNEKDYLRIWQYIDENPAKWDEDKYYTL